ncbi:hypothetical protein [Arachnia propionica]|uniref:Transmembrane protein n=1 Tax=Arachnia propionica TaxID=1750 RepID=A0A3P1WY43_9ACTN|nr:hypothetical protein [Arachnia propionica]RRD50320.1 hypothetical protein EII35_05040 [Arachnia propionica]
MRSPVSHHRIKGGRFIVAASPKLLDGELTRTSILRSRSWQVPSCLVGALLTLCFTLMAAWTTPTSLNLTCARRAAHEPVNCVFTTTSLSQRDEISLEDVRSIRKSRIGSGRGSYNSCSLSTWPRSLNGHTWACRAMDPTPFAQLIDDPLLVDDVTHSDNYQLDWWAVAAFAITTLVCAWLGIGRREDLRWEIDPPRGLVKVTHGSLLGVDTETVRTPGVPQLERREKGNLIHVAVAGTQRRMAHGLVRTTDASPHTLEAYRRFTDSLVSGQ